MGSQVSQVNLSNLGVKSPLLEVYSKDILAGIDNHFGVLWRSRLLEPYYKGIDRQGVLYFTTNSGTRDGLNHYQRVQLLDLKDSIELGKSDKRLTNLDLTNLAVFGNIKVYCSCESFRYYGWQYMSWELGYGLEPELRFPSARNPNLYSSVCKHLYLILKTMPMFIASITGDLVRQGLLKGRSRRKTEPEPEDKSPWHDSAV